SSTRSGALETAVRAVNGVSVATEVQLNEFRSRTTSSAEFPSLNCKAVRISNRSAATDVNGYTRESSSWASCRASISLKGSISSGLEGGGKLLSLTRFSIEVMEAQYGCRGRPF